MKTVDLTLITPTRNRARCFSLLEGYVARQTVRPKRWLVCNDGREEYAYTMGQEVIRRDPAGDTLPSICANYLALLERLQGERVLFVEDDDWIAPAFLETMAGLLEGADLVGLVPNFFYHVGNRAYCSMLNGLHSSLASTGCAAAVLPLVREACLKGDIFIDLYLWRRWTGSRLLHTPVHMPEPPLHVGLKGCWGERGLGLGHQLVEPVDEDWGVLRRWLGRDAEAYIRV